MDVYCRFDREPWDNDTIHEEVAERHRIFEDEKEPKEAQRLIEATTYTSVLREFQRYGCGAFPAFSEGGLNYDHKGDVVVERCPRASGGGADEQISALYDLLGDDMDGATSMLEDMRIV